MTLKKRSEIHFKYTIFYLMLLVIISMGMNIPVMGARASDQSDPVQFDGKGILDDIYPKGLVINDCYFPLVPLAVIMIDGQRVAGNSIALKKGSQVGYQLDSRGWIRLLALIRKADQGAIDN